MGVINATIFLGFPPASTQAQAFTIGIINLSTSHDTYFGKG